MSDKKDKILQSALKMFTHQGFHSSPTSKIVAQAGVSHGVLFHYFGSKENLIMALYSQTKEQLNDYLFSTYPTAASTQDRMRHLYVRTLQWAQRFQLEFAYIQLFQSSPYYEQARQGTEQRYAKVYLGLLDEAIEQALIIERPTDYLLALMSSQIIGVHHYLLSKNANQEDTKTIANSSFDLMWKMVR